jgi:hypothetical protein
MANTEQSPILQALERWILKHDSIEKDVLYLVSGGKSYSLNQIYEEVKNRTEFGLHMEQNIINLAIDLLTRNNE